MDNKPNIITQVKAIVQQYDAAAELILFGSRARGDYNEESDWDILVLSLLPVTDNLKDVVRTEILHKIEIVTFSAVNIIWYNKNEWHTQYAVTNLYDSIREEGIAV